MHEDKMSLKEWIALCNSIVTLDRCFHMRRRLNPHHSKDIEFETKRYNHMIYSKFMIAKKFYCDNHEQYEKEAIKHEDKETLEIFKKLIDDDFEKAFLLEDE